MDPVATHGVPWPLSALVGLLAAHLSARESAHGFRGSSISIPVARRPHTGSKRQIIYRTFDRPTKLRKEGCELLFLRESTCVSPQLSHRRLGYRRWRALPRCPR